MRVLITGISGQDGSYLAEQLVARGDEVHGVSRRAGAPIANLAGVAGRVTLHGASLTDPDAVDALVAAVEPERVFHLAARSFIGSDEAVGMGFNVDSTLCLLEVLARRRPGARLLLAGSAAQLAGAQAPQSERARPAPLTTYGLSKQLAADAVAFFRDTRGLHAATAILFNHESPRRPPRYVSKKLATAAARIARGLERSVAVGDLDACRDWGYAPEYVDAMARMTELDVPEDLALATGVSHSVREMADAAFAAAGLDAAAHLVVEPRLVRPPDPVPLVGDAARAHAVLGWRPRASLADIMREMVQAETAALAR